MSNYPASPQPYYPSGQPQSPVTSPLAWVSFGLGIASFIFLWFIGGIAAVVTGHIALAQIKHRRQQQGHGIALTGLILGYVNVAISLLVFTLAIIGIVIGANSPRPTINSEADRQYQQCLAQAGDDSYAVSQCLKDFVNSDN